MARAVFTKQEFKNENMDRLLCRAARTKISIWPAQPDQISALPSTAPLSHCHLIVADTPATSHRVDHYLKGLPAQQRSASYAPRSLAAHQTADATRTGNVERPGAGIYLSNCAKCHGAQGEGQEQKYSMLAGNPAVLANNTTSLVRLLVESGNSPHTLDGPPRQKMDSFAGRLTNTEMAQVLTIIRTTWGNNAGPVTTRDVMSVRQAIHK
jgi:mono/diheme cytochrome c family protein